jgi:hypothetical protein
MINDLPITPHKRGGLRHSPERWSQISVAVSRDADRRAWELLPVIEAIRAAGAQSLREIAEALVERRIPTPSGCRCWHPVQVLRVIAGARWHVINLEHQERLRALAAARGE